MGCVRKRRGRWVADYRDATGRRRWETCRTKAEAEDALARAVPASRQRRYPVVSSDVTLAEYADRWIELCASLKPRSREGYRRKLDRHILPAFGALQVRRIHRGAVRQFLMTKLGSGLSRGTVQFLHATLRALLASAVEDDVIRANPAAGLGRSLKITSSEGERQDRIKAFDRVQLEHFLRAAEQKTPALWALFFVLSRTGCRLGEGLGLRWDDVDLEKRELRVERAVSQDGEISTPKSGHGRVVDLSQSAVEMLRAYRARALEEDLRRGEPSPWLFPAPENAQTPLKHWTVQEGFKRALRAARLPSYYSTHCLRHTYASILLAEGVSPAYVQEQLGHAKIQLTVGTYGRWLRKKAPGAADLIDAPGSAGAGLDRLRVVAEEGKTVAAASGEPARGPSQVPTDSGGSGHVAPARGFTDGTIGRSAPNPPETTSDDLTRSRDKGGS